VAIHSLLFQIFCKPQTSKTFFQLEKKRHQQFQFLSLPKK